MQTEALGFDPIQCFACGRIADAQLIGQLFSGHLGCRPVFPFSRNGERRLDDEQAIAICAMAARRKNGFRSSDFVYITFHGV
jgi:hypothetical protein